MKHDLPKGAHQEDGPKPAETSREPSRPTSLVVIKDPGEAASMCRVLDRRGFNVIVDPDPDRSLRYCRESPPALVVVDSSLPGISARGFLAQLLRISWTTATILIADRDEETVHEETEGLGILGSIRSKEDLDALDFLLAKYADMATGIGNGP
jgi:DNA-binding NarL/FixJ family response regulator